MYRVALVTMPFSSVRLPSIALTQLRFVVQSALADNVSVEIFYLNQDFARLMGLDQYARISDSPKATTAGLGDWLFRRAAFPDAEDNAEQYFGRYGFQLSEHRDLLEPHQQLRDKLEGLIDELIDRHELTDFHLVGLTSMFAQSVASFAMARKLKARNPDIVTAIGGANCEATMGAVIARNVESIDYVFSGPALKSFPELVRRLAEGEHDHCDQIQGVLTASTNGSAEIGEELGLETEIPLDYDDFIESLATRCPDADPSLLFETSRGCWWGERSHCTFCGLNGTTMQYRSMSPEKALSQFNSLLSYYPKVKRFESVDNILPKSYLTDVLPKLQPPHDVDIFYEVKSDLKEEEMRTLAESRVTQIQPGIEALATSTLKLMRKGTTAFHNIKFLKYALVYQVDPAWNLLIGFPGEGEDVYQKYLEDLRLLTHLPPPMGVFPVRFDRFSPYFTQAKEYGLDLKVQDFYELVYPFEKSDLDDLAYFFEDRNYGSDYVKYAAKWIKKLESAVDDWVKKWGDGITTTARWHSAGPKAHPVLTPSSRDETGMTIFDTRSGEPVEHALDAMEAELIELIETPMWPERIVEQLDGLSQASVENTLSSMRARGLVFEEGGKYMNLLVDAGREVGEI